MKQASYEPTTMRTWSACWWKTPRPFRALTWRVSPCRTPTGPMRLASCSAPMLSGAMYLPQLMGKYIAPDSIGALHDAKRIGPVGVLHGDTRQVNALNGRGVFHQQADHVRMVVGS